MKGRNIHRISTVAMMWIGMMLPFAASAQPVALSDSARASVITCGPGDEFYLRFGHSAIRICDPYATPEPIDRVYNYGTFDFGVPHFYLRFAQGKLDYCLSRIGFDRFMSTYRGEQRAVWEQTLQLSPREVANLFLLLEQNYLPDYRYYRYDFFLDNCATRVRDMVQAACGHRPPAVGEFRTTTFRRYVHQAVDNTQLWWLLGVDMLLGLPTDRRCSTDEAMFYPMVMMAEYAAADRAGTPLVHSTRRLLDDSRTPLHRSFPPLVVFGLLLVATLLLRRFVPKAMPVADRVLFIVAGLAGLLLCYMWFLTDHSCTAWNPNILWASPLLILVAIRLDRSPRWALWFQMGCFALAALWVVLSGASLALLPLILTLALRVWDIMRGNRVARR